MTAFYLLCLFESGGHTAGLLPPRKRLCACQEGGVLYEVTSRTVHSRFLLRPGPLLNEIIVGALGRAQRLYPIEICGFFSNHFHLIARARSARFLSPSGGRALPPTLSSGDSASRLLFHRLTIPLRPGAFSKRVAPIAGGPVGGSGSDVGSEQPTQTSDLADSFDRLAWKLQSRAPRLRRDPPKAPEFLTPPDFCPQPEAACSDTYSHRRLGSLSGG
jgi:hypothetical protein